MKNRSIAAAALLAAGLLSACNSGDGNASPTGGGPEDNGSQGIAKPCALFTEEVAVLMGSAPFNPPMENVNATVSMCQRISSNPVAGDMGTFARFEKISKSSFLEYQCSPPKDTSFGNWEVEMISGVGETACEIKIGSSAVSVLAWQDGYAVQVGNSSRAKCVQALGQLLPKLPK